MKENMFLIRPVVLFIIVFFLIDFVCEPFVSYSGALILLS